MKSNKLNYIHEAFTILTFCILIVILFNPWLQLISSLIKDEGIKDVQLYWQFIILILTILVFRLSVFIEKESYSFSIILSFIMLNIYFVYLVGWQPYLFYPLLTLLILAGYRFTFYQNIDLLHFDMAIIIIFFIINLALQNRLGFNIGLFDIFLFIFSAIGLVTLSHTRQLGKYGYKTSYRLIYFMIGFFFLAIILFSFVFGVSIQSNILSIFIKIVAWIYEILSQLLLLILYPVVRLIGPLMDRLINMIQDLSADQEREPTELNLGEENNFEGIEINEQNFEIPSYVYWGLLFAIIIVIVYYMLKRLKRRKEKQSANFSEERESIFTIKDLKEDLSSLMDSILKPLKFWNRKKKIYDTDDPVMLIRKIYYQFLLKTNGLFSYRKYQTPLEYYKVLTKRKSGIIIKEKEVKDLTQIYNQARYYQKVTDTDVKNAEEIWQELNKND